MTSRASRLGLLLAFFGMFRCVGYVPGIELELRYRAQPNEREGLTLDEARVSIVAVELAECADRLAFDWGPALARAHAPEETEQTIAFDAMDEPDVSGGVMFPEPGRYCGARLHLMPQPMRDAHTLLLAGELHGEPFVVFSDEPIDVSIRCEAPVVLDEASSTTIAVTLEPEAWLDDEGRLRVHESEGFRCRFAASP